jgi:hydroxyacylglutathione hydrolase
MHVQRVPVHGTNCYLLREDDGTILIDPGPPGGAAIAISGVEGAGVRPEDVRLILVTHGHLDHYGAVTGVKEWCRAPVAAFRTEPDLSRDRRYTLPPAQTLRGSLMRWAFLALSPLLHSAALEADLLLDDGEDLSHYGVTAQTLLVPGHSSGSLAVISSEGDAFVGDLFVNYAVPGQPIYLSDRHAWQQSYRRIQQLKPRTVYVGHGEPFPGEKLSHIYPARYQLRWWVR